MIYHPSLLNSLDLNYPTFLLLLSATGNKNIPKDDGNVGSLKNKDQTYFSDTSCSTTSERRTKCRACTSAHFAKFAKLQLTSKHCSQGWADTVRKKNKAKGSWLLLQQELGVWEWGTSVCQNKRRTKLVGREKSF